MQYTQRIKFPSTNETKLSREDILCISNSCQVKMVLRVFRLNKYVFCDKQITIIVMGYCEAKMILRVFRLNKYNFLTKKIPSS